jgi:hypothetical protein
MRGDESTEYFGLAPIYFDDMFTTAASTANSVLGDSLGGQGFAVPYGRINLSPFSRGFSMALF